MKKLLMLAVAAFAAGSAAAQMNQPIPADPEVRTGKLENGMTYYIRHNEKPKGQADFYILHDVGAIQENDSQQGLAHFLEHMAFNGTKNLPGKQLTEYLETVGVKFGANLNAGTSWDYTCYNMKDVPTSRICEWGAVAADKFKVVFGLNTSAAVLGLGYIIGLKYAMIITAGSCLVWFVIVPVVGSLAEAVDPAAMLSLLGVTRADIVADPQSIFTAENLFAFIGKPIGIGGIAMAGIIGIIRQSKIIRQAVGLAVSEFGGGKSAAAAPERTQRDISMKRILTILIATLISVFVFFHFGLLDGWVQSVTAILIVFIIAFLFTTVAANAIAIVGTNPVSGMTLMTLILSSLVLVSVGLSGTTGMTAALVIGGVVCTALSMAGGFITDLKIGYWLGTTPRKQEAWKFLGTFVAAATVAGVMIILNKSYGFVGEGALVAPQANAMAAVIQPLMTGGQTPWMLYFCGAALALVLTSIGVPALAFALGMFIPMELNAPLVVGGLVAWFVSNRSKDEALNKARFDRGTLIASGFIAGGALMGVVSALLKFAEVDWFLSGWASSNAAEWTGLVMYLALIGYFGWHTLKAKEEE